MPGPLQPWLGVTHLRSQHSAGSDPPVVTGTLRSDGSLATGARYIEYGTIMLSCLCHTPMSEQSGRGDGALSTARLTSSKGVAAPSVTAATA